MRVEKTALACFIGLALLGGSVAKGQTDVKDSQDHALVGRFVGSTIRVYEAKDFDEYTVGLGKLSFRNNAFQWSKSEKIEGRVTRITYLAPATASTAAIVRSYEEALRKAGFAPLFTADEQGLGYRYDTWHYKVYPDPQRKRPYLLGPRSPRYLVAKLARPEGDVWAVVYAAFGGTGAKNSPTVQLDIIEIKALAAGLVTAETMAEGLAKTGRVAIYSIYFDTDKAEIKPESERTLKEIAKLIQQNPGLHLYVVGHTDNVGTLPYNMDLSERRADAVVKALAAGHGADPARLRSAGVGPLAPVAPNKAEDGRAKNRRVELVAQ